MGAALGAMVGWMTYGKRKFDSQDAVMRRLIPPLHEGMKDLLPMIDRDTRAFDAYLAAVGCPGTRTRRRRPATPRCRPASRRRCSAPRGHAGGRPLLGGDAGDGRARQPASRSDLEVGARALETGVWGAFRNVAINLPGIEDEAFRRTTAEEAESLASRAAAMRDAVLKTLATRKA